MTCPTCKDHCKDNCKCDKTGGCACCAPKKPCCSKCGTNCKCDPATCKCDK